MNTQHATKLPAVTLRSLLIKWGTSRGRDTYGYTTAALYENGTKKAACNGGGYDMRGTVFAEWLEHEYQDRLLALAKRGKFARVQWNGKTEDDKNQYTYPDRDKPRAKLLYGGTYFNKGSRALDGKKTKILPPYVSLDGGCGFSSMQRIAKAIGLEVSTLDASRKLDVLTVKDSGR